MPSDGRYALTPDRVSSSAVTSPAPSMEESEDGTVTGCFIMGLGNMDIKELVPLAKSWLQSPELTITSGPYKSLGYDRNQRAHIFSQTPDIAGDIKLNFTVFATEDNPIVNPAFVIKNWGDIPVRFTINDTQLERGANFRYGYNPTLTGTDLIVWLKTVSQKPMQISIMPEHRL